MMKEKILIYCGVNEGSGLSQMLKGSDWTKVYGFEANTVLYEQCIDKFKNDNRVKLFNVILSLEHDIEREFYIQDANGRGDDACGSRGIIPVNIYTPLSGNSIQLKKIIKVKTMNLYRFIQKENISEVHTLLTDLEGGDLDVIKSVKPLIDNKQIKYLQCEVEPDTMPIKYTGLDNKLGGFNEVLSENYKITWKDPYAKDSGNAEVGDWFSIDYRWKLK